MKYFEICNLEVTCVSVFVVRMTPDFVQYFIKSFPERIICIVKINTNVQVYINVLNFGTCSFLIKQKLF